MEMRLLFLARLLAPRLLVDCKTAPEAQKERPSADVPDVVGSQIGGGDGSPVTEVVGTIAGGFVDHAIGTHLDSANQIWVREALERSRKGGPSTWRNPGSDATCTVVPTRASQGTTVACRKYTLATDAGFKPGRLPSMACRQSKGNWKRS